MSHEIYGFCTINSMSDGVMDNIAPLGELSPYARTFSARKTELSDPVYENVGLTIFRITEDNAPMDMPAGSTPYLLSMMEDIVTTSSPTIGIGEVFTSRFTNAVLLDAGEVIDHAGMSIPSYIKWTEVVDGEPLTLTVWFSDTEFRAGYRHHEIRIVPPIPNVGDLMGDMNTVLQILADYEVSEQIQAQELVRDNDPSTKTATVKLKWVDVDTGGTIDLTWVLVTFGDSGLLYENQIEAIRNYLITTTGDSIDNWAIRLPDLIVTLSLSIIPLWDKVAIRASGSIQYVHSPMASTDDILQASMHRYPSGPTPLEMTRIIFTTIAYKSLGFIAFPEIDGGEFQMFNEVYPDYAMIPLNDLNLNRLAETTRAAIQAIEFGLRVAEEYAEGMSIPSPLSKAVDGDNVYISYVTDGVKHRILTRASYMGETVNV